jgi:hypothetical protein
MAFRIVPRTEIGLPAVVTGSDGVTRRQALSNERWLTFHYTGVSSRGYKEADVAREVLRIQEVFHKTKPFEYNYVIGQREDALIYEFAGKFAAAHSAGENNDSFGLLFLNAVNEPLTPTQIRKAQWLRDVLIYDGSLSRNVEQLPHREMPGAATACPGEHIMGVLAELRKPYVEPPQPIRPIASPTRPPLEDEDMKPKLVRLDGSPAVYAQWAGFKTWVPNPAALDALRFVYKVEVDVIDKRFPSFLVAGGPIVGPLPPNVDGWGVPR